jgi:hypothetical protein
MRRQRKKVNPFVAMMLYSIAAFLFAGGLVFVFSTAVGQLAVQANHYMALVMSISIVTFFIGLIGFYFTRKADL